VYSKDDNDKYTWQIVSTPVTALLTEHNLSDLQHVDEAQDNLQLYSIISNYTTLVVELAKQITGLKLSVEKHKNRVGEILCYPFKVNNKNLLLLNGQEVNKNDYPLLWDFIKDEVIDYTDDIKYSGKFKKGSTDDTFILPDYRGVFIRNFDDNRGLNPYITNIGEYKPDVLKAHNHQINYKGSAFDNTCVDVNDCDTNVNDSWVARHIETELTGGKETTPKYINAVYYIIAK
jgi:hypothetical protein